MRTPTCRREVASVARFAALAALLALVIAACSSTDDSDDATSETGDGTETSAPGPDESAPEATDEPGDPTDEILSVEGPTTGVTDDTIKIAAMIGDFSALAGTGLVIDIGDEEQQYQAFVDEVNANGGINGRTIELVPIYYDVVDDATQPVACIQATEEEEVFVVVAAGGFQGEAVSCVTQQHETPLISSTSLAESFHADSDERYFSIGPSLTRHARAWAQLLADSGDLEGKTVGIVHTDQPSNTEFVDEGLVPTLEALGVEVVEQVALPCETRQCEQHENAVERLRAKDVDAIFLALGAVSSPTFVQAADNVGYRPQYFVFDTAVTATVSKLFEPVRDAFTGAVAVGRYALAPDNLDNPVMQECNEIFTERTGVVWEAGDFNDPDIDKWNSTGSNCITLRHLFDAIEATGDNLNQRSLSLALQQTGALDTTAPASWRPGKLDGGDGFRIMRYNPECYDADGVDCWLLDTEEWTIVE